MSDTFASHASVVHDVTVTDSLVESGSAQGRVSAIFTRQTSIFNKEGEILVKNCCLSQLFHFHRAREASGSVPVKMCVSDIYARLPPPPSPSTHTFPEHLLYYAH